MAGLLFLTVLLFFLPLLQKEASYAEIVISMTGETTVIPLDTDAMYTVSSRGVTLCVSVAGGAVSVSDADCRDGICAATPPISRAGQSIVCAPAGVVIRITGEEAIVDGVSG